jgi:cobalt/nickel transport protein
MKTRHKGFIWIGLGIALLLALFLSPFASSSPDGLEKVADRKGFAEKGEGWSFWQHAPFKDYTLPWIKNERVSTGIAGLVGTLAVFFIAVGLGKLFRKSQTHEDVSETRGRERPLPENRSHTPRDY